MASGSPLFGLLSLTITVALLVWQYMVVTKYAEGAFYNTSQVGMTATCVSVFLVLQKSLLLTIFLTALEVYIVAIAVVPPCAIFCWPCLFLATCGACLAGIAKFMVSVMGIIVVMSAKRSECADCADLYSCAWYVFIGMLIFSILTGCLQSCHFEKAPERQPLVRAAGEQPKTEIA
mmetsp:Transcript_21469/g.47633  ORF Transcript_21469/g.47633 Transcript_21469/m.47633 type:complete len:176 (+) Transcript_21469:88-615(+)|eukprot:CAMPEP_0170612228 /NCGR_PEP_ID=MMETSP0224-20130122/23612_1 /TAXON_ID=285029 /ORGANISM="Togula jolla, Strain CCCM 725" /LENGTH=175 /DNA_ID=CAMNT_0010937719 /DNA_START=69 /DNA_END=596 /DNA_ORIENTATION=-